MPMSQAHGRAKETGMSNKIRMQKKETPNTLVVKGVTYKAVEATKPSKRTEMEKWLDSCPIALKHVPAREHKRECWKAGEFKSDIIVSVYMK